jgi:hypothetical protein
MDASAGMDAAGGGRGGDALGGSAGADAGLDAARDGGCSGYLVCFSGGPYLCADVGMPGICDNGTWKCPGGSSTADECICWDAPPPMRFCRDAGRPEPCVESGWPSPVCGALCGNGARDMCSFRLGPQPSCAQVSITENCDGQDFGAESCQSRGFAGGRLTCSGACTIENRTCTDCVPPTAPVVACGHPPVVSAVTSDIDMAGTDNEMGLAWIDGFANEANRLVLTRLSPSLDVIGSTDLEGPATTQALLPGRRSIGVASFPAGWIVGMRREAAFNMPEVSFHAIDAQGRDAGTVVVDDSPDWPPESAFVNLLLASRPAGGPLIAWQTQSALRAAVIANDGRTATSPLSVAIGPDARLTAAAYVGDAFYVSLLSQTEAAAGAVEYRLFIVRVQADGRAGSVFEALPGEVAGPATLVAGGPDLRVVYTAHTPGAASLSDLTLYWRRLDASGKGLGAPVALANDPNGFGIYPLAVGRDNETVVLLNEFGTQAAIARVDAQGQVLTPVRNIIESPGFYTFALARRGTDVVVGWLAELGFGLARIAP